MATWLKQSTAVDIPIGPFLDSADGNTEKTGLTLTQPDIRLKKNGGNWAQKSAAQTLSHEEAGWYECSLSTTDTDTLGTLVLSVHESGALPVWREFMVVAANIYDSVIGGGDLLDVNVSTVDTAAGNAIADSILDRANGVETGYSMRGVLRLISAALLGKATGLNTGSPVFRDITDTKDRITGTSDASGNRSASTLDPS